MFQKIKVTQIRSRIGSQKNQIASLRGLGLWKINMQGTSIPYVTTSRFGAGKVLMKPAEKGHGIIAAGAVRAVMEAVGIMDISIKCLGSRNPNNLVRCTLNGLYNLRSNEWTAKARGKEINYINEQ